MNDHPATATVLAVDLGTGGPKTALVTIDGRVLGARHQRVEPVVRSDGTGTQDPTSWWAAIQADTAALTAEHPQAAAALVAVAVTGQWGSTVPVDATGDPVGDCMLWMDTRGGPLARKRLGGRVTIDGFAPRKAVTWIQRSGGAPSPEGNDPLGHRLWIEHHQPDLYARTATFLEPIDYVNVCFTGVVSASPVSMLLSWLCDNRDLQDTSYDEILVTLAGVDPARLPPLVPTMSVMGHVLDGVAGRLGLPADLPVVTALPDLHTAALGSGGLGVFEGHLSISTSAWVGCHTNDKKTSMSKQMATVPSALPGRYLLANNHETAGVCAEWARNLLGADTLEELDAVAAEVPSGSGGVLFTPWLNGERSPVADANLRGSFHNLSLATDRTHLARAVLEGVAHNARWLLEASEKVVRHPLEDLRVIGGGAVSDVWCQIHADVLGRPLHRVAQPLLVNVQGAAFFAALTLGLLDEHEIPALIEIDRVFQPDPASRWIHDLLHDEFVQRAKTDKDMYARLNGPEGLPLG